MNKTLKISLIAGGCAAVLAIGAGIWYYVGHNSADPVGVFEFNMVGMSDYWGDSLESYGNVTTDKIQTVYLTDTQKITEVHVAPGDPVKKGDPLVSFDTTLSDLALERKRLEVEKAKLQLEAAQSELQQILGMVPRQEVDFSGIDQDLGPEWNQAFQFSGNDNFRDYDGRDEYHPLVVWITGDRAIDGSLAAEIQEECRRLQTLNYVPPAPPEGEEAPQIPPVTDPPVMNLPIDSGVLYCVLKITTENRWNGANEVFQGFKFVGGTPYLSSCTAPDPFEKDDMSDLIADMMANAWGSGFTANEIAQMRNAKEKEILDLTFKHKTAQNEYDIAKTEMMDGTVRSQIDGKVVSVLTPEEAKERKQPMIKVSGGGGFYIKGTISELQRDSLPIGMEVTIQDWSTGGSYTGTVHSLGDFPTQANSWSSMENPNTSYYPFTVFVDESADLAAGSNVSIQFSLAGNDPGIYLQSAFVLSSDEGNFVYIQGKNNRLEKRAVSVGKSLWGSYTEIKGGITAEDKIAFPYGKNVREGAKTVDGDLTVLYG